MSMQMSSSPFEPDPYAPLPPADALMLLRARALSPLAPGQHLLQSQAAPTQFGGRKALRPTKERPPRANRADPRRILGSAIATSALAPTAGIGAAPPPALPTVFSFETGGDDNTTTPPDVAGAFSKTHAFNPLNNVTAQVLSQAVPDQQARHGWRESYGMTTNPEQDFG